MARWVPLAVAVAVAGVLVAARGHIGRFLRRVDQRSGLFAPYGAAFYNAVAPKLLGPLYRRVADEVAASGEVRALHDISAVLEIGSGPGELALEIARRLPGTEIHGVDLAEEMVRRANERARSAALDGQVRFVAGDAAALPLASQTIDIVVSTLSLHHWADPAAAFAEIGRVLRPGGVALVYDIRPFAYTRRELEVFLAGTVFEGADVERAPVTIGLAGLLFIRIRLVRPPDA